MPQVGHCSLNPPPVLNTVHVAYFNLSYFNCHWGVQCHSLTCTRKTSMLWPICPKNTCIYHHCTVVTWHYVYVHVSVEKFTVYLCSFCKLSFSSCQQLQCSCWLNSRQHVLIHWISDFLHLLSFHIFCLLWTFRELIAEGADKQHNGENRKKIVNVILIYIGN